MLVKLMAKINKNWNHHPEYKSKKKCHKGQTQAAKKLSPTNPDRISQKKVTQLTFFERIRHVEWLTSMVVSKSHSRAFDL